MAKVDEDFWDYDEEERPPDPRQEEAVEGLEATFEANRDKVFFSRQLEVLYEGRWFHWVTNRALRELVEGGAINTEVRRLTTGQDLHLMWHRSYRYYRRAAASLVRLVEEYAAPNVTGAIGLQGEAMVLEGFARKQFVLQARNAREFRGRTWTETAHDLDFIFERDSIAYGVEVKNTLGYMDHKELGVKVEICKHLGLRPVFAVRMLPKSWVWEVVEAGGFALIFKYQLYPWAHRDLAKQVRSELGLPVDSPRALEDGTMERFLRWHRRHM